MPTMANSTPSAVSAPPSSPTTPATGASGTITRVAVSDTIAGTAMAITPSTQRDEAPIAATASTASVRPLEADVTTGQPTAAARST